MPFQQQRAEFAFDMAAIIVTVPSLRLARRTYAAVIRSPIGGSG
jgi:hypothetical protein